jgi:hypothetical protein
MTIASRWVMINICKFPEQTLLTSFGEWIDINIETYNCANKISQMADDCKSFNFSQ